MLRWVLAGEEGSPESSPGCASSLLRELTHSKHRDNDTHQSFLVSSLLLTMNQTQAFLYNSEKAEI